MKQAKANVLGQPVLAYADAICFTSNGNIRKDGRAVMGAGVAKAFRDTIPNIDLTYAAKLREVGLHTCVVDTWNPPLSKPPGTLSGVFASKSWIQIVAFPTKFDWKNKSSITLIERSAHELVALADKYEWERVFLPRPGCANGGLSWGTEVLPLLDILLDDRFCVCHL